MKKMMLFIIIGLLLVSGGSFYFLKSEPTNDDYIPPRLTSKYNFDYSGGEKPWATHIKTDLNTTFESVLNGNEYLRSLKCAGDSTDVGKTPFGPVKPICLQGSGTKMIVPILGNKISYFIFNSPQKGGLFEQEHIASGVPFHFFDNKSKLGTKYFVIPFNSYEVPTYYPIESKIFLSIWKQVFQKVNGTNDDYFNNHIFVVGASSNQLNIGGKLEKRFSVTYYFQIDWARTKLTDSFTYSFEGIGEGITLEELQHDVSVPSYQTKFNRILNINKVKPISHIADKTQIKKAVQTASSLLQFDVNKDMILDRNGQLIIRLHGTVDDAANECLFGTVVLESADVSEVRGSSCRIH